jgi:pilus assembly protein CpaC
MQTFHPKNYVLVLCLSAYAVLPHALHADPTTAPTVKTLPTMATAPAAALRVPSPEATAGIAVPLFQSRVVTLDKPAARISVANPDLADIVVISPTEFYLLAKDIGVTNLLVWDRGSKARSAVQVEITHDLEGLKSKLHLFVPGADIEAHSAQRSIVLTGSVPSATAMNAVVRIAEGYLAQIISRKGEQFQQESGSRREDKTVGGVINLLEVAGAQQVMLEVKVAEVARSELRRIDPRFNAFGVDGNWSFGGVNGGATFPDALFGVDSLRAPVFSGGGGASTGPVVDEFAPSDLFIQDKGLFASYLSGNFALNIAIDAAKDKGLAKVLAEPTLTTLTGQEASFLSGGEFPVPVPRGVDSVGIEFKDFGVGLRVLPTVLGTGRINVRIEVSVSELSNATTVLLSPGQSNSSFVVPSLTKRSASGTVELADGQTIGLAGLINDNMRSAVSKFPGLGSLPVLGSLFRSQDFVKGQTELVILVTPRLAKPVDPKRLRLPTDGYREPSDADFYLRGLLQAPEPKTPATTPESPR